MNCYYQLPLNEQTVCYIKAHLLGSGERSESGSLQVGRRPCRRTVSGGLQHFKIITIIITRDKAASVLLLSFQRHFNVPDF